MAQVEQFPIFRIATLLTQRLSSPISKQLKVYAHQHPRFGTAICARAGRWYRAGELRFKLWVLKLPGPRFPIAVSHREAIDIGTDILGEAAIFGLGATIIVYEVNRQAENKEAKILDKQSRWVAILTALDELKIEVDTQQKEIDLLLGAIRELDPDVPLPLLSTLSTLSKPLHVPDPTTDLLTLPPISDQHASVLSRVAAPHLSPLPLPTPKLTTDEVTPLHSPPAPQSPTIVPPSSQPPADAEQPGSTTDSSCKSVWLLLVDLAEDELFD